MTFVLSLNGSVYGVYETVDLVRVNLLIILFYNLERGNIELSYYEDLLDYLKSDSFSENTFFIPQFQSSIKQLDLTIEEFVNEKNGGCPLEYIMNHINWRFMELEKKMERDVRVKVTFPGENAKDHALGEPYFKDWKYVDRKNHKTLTDSLREYITAKIEVLQKRFKGRVHFGEVMYENANDKSIQVWSANGANWNLPEGDEIPGKYQAEEMKFQGPGVYGIVVTPLYGYHSLVPEEYET